MLAFKPKELMNCTIYVRVTEATRDAIWKGARRHDITISDYVRHCVDRYQETLKKQTEKKKVKR